MKYVASLLIGLVSFTLALFASIAMWQGIKRIASAIAAMSLPLLCLVALAGNAHAAKPKRAKASFFGTCPIPSPPPDMVLVECKVYVTKNVTFCSWQGVIRDPETKEDKLCGTWVKMPGLCGPWTFGKTSCRSLEDERATPSGDEKQGLEL